MMKHYTLIIFTSIKLVDKEIIRTKYFQTEWKSVPSRSRFQDRSHIVQLSGLDTFHSIVKFLAHVVALSIGSSEVQIIYHLRIPRSLLFIYLFFACVVLRQISCYCQTVEWVLSARVAQVAQFQLIEHSHSTRKCLGLTPSLDIFCTRFGNFQLVSTTLYILSLTEFVLP